MIEFFFEIKPHRSLGGLNAKPRFESLCRGWGIRNINATFIEAKQRCVLRIGTEEHLGWDLALSIDDEGGRDISQMIERGQTACWHRAIKDSRMLDIICAPTWRSLFYNWVHN